MAVVKTSISDKTRTFRHSSKHNGVERASNDHRTESVQRLNQTEKHEKETEKRIHNTKKGWNQMAEKKVEEEKKKKCITMRPQSLHALQLWGSMFSRFFMPSTNSGEEGEETTECEKTTRAIQSNPINPWIPCSLS